MSNSTTTVDASTTATTAATSQTTDIASSVTSSIPTTTPVSVTPSTSVSIISQSPTSTFVVEPSTTSQSVAIVSSTVIVSPSTSLGSTGPTVVTITSTQAAVTITPSNTQGLSTASASSSSATPSILGTSGSSGNNGSGLSTSGKIAIAVVIPIVVVAALFFLGIFLWRRRKANRNAEEERKNDMAEYGFNPNNDPTLVPVGAAYTDNVSEGDDGYRGWGTTSSNPRKASTTMGSNNRLGNGMTQSDTTSQPGNYGYQGSPNGHASEHWSGDPLIGGHSEGIDEVAALGAGAAAGGMGAAAARNNRLSTVGVQRGPSNASSTYSHNPPHSETSSDSPGNVINYYQEEVPYNIYNDVAPSHGPYGEGTHGPTSPDQPVIRDVQARRNTRIERVPTFPQTQGGISQNF